MTDNARPGTRAVGLDEPAERRKTLGADRLRLTHFDSVQALIDLSFCMGTALMLGQERNNLGVGYAAPPDEAFAA